MRHPPRGSLLVRLLIVPSVGFLVAACGNAPGSPGPGSASPDAAASGSAAPETGGGTTKGDIPDSAVFLTYKGGAPAFSVQYVEGWQVTPQAAGVVIRDRDSSETVTIAPAPADVAAWIAVTDIPALQAQAGFRLVKQDRVRVGGATYDHLRYHLPAAPVPVTREQVPSTVDRYWRGLSADARRLSRNDLTLRRLLARTVVALSSMTDTGTLVHGLDVSRPTAGAYVDVLAASFALIALYQRDAKRQDGPALRRPRTLHLGDPALAAIPGVFGGPAPSEEALVENALAIALLRADRAALEGFAHPDHLYYWRTADDREVDFLVTEPSLVAVESKYAAHLTGTDCESMTKAFGQGIMVSRRDVELNRKVLTVPAGVLLALFG